MTIVLKNILSLILIAFLMFSCKGKPVEETPAIPAQSTSKTESIAKEDTDSLLTSNSMEMKNDNAALEIKKEASGIDQKVNTKISEPPAKPKMVFSSLEHNFGKITQDSMFIYHFEFENKGNAPLIINNAIGSCGCTIASYPFIPIAPGEKDVIEVKYNSTGKMGLQNPTITVISNSEPKKITLHLKGIVIPKEKG